MYTLDMTTDDLLAEVDRRTAVELSEADLAPLLEEAELVRRDQTGIAGSIRTLRLGKRVLVQERNQEGRHFVRGLPSEDAARRFVEARLAAYERMWDG